MAAFASYAPGCKMIEVAAICDNTILGSGKKGILSVQKESMDLCLTRIGNRDR